VKLAVMDRLAWVADVLIHVEPHLSEREINARTDLRLTQKQ
jgi:hypothetical protein